MQLRLSEHEVHVVITSLREKAHSIAAHSQKPDLIDQESLFEWRLADKIVAMRKELRKLSKKPLVLRENLKKL